MQFLESLLLVNEDHRICSLVFMCCLCGALALVVFVVFKFVVDAVYTIGFKMSLFGRFEFQSNMCADCSICMLMRCKRNFVILTLLCLYFWWSRDPSLYLYFWWSRDPKLLTVAGDQQKERKLIAQLQVPSAFFIMNIIWIVHSFILNIYIAPLEESDSKVLTTPARLKRAVLRREKRRWLASGKGTKFRREAALDRGPTTEKVN